MPNNVSFGKCCHRWVDGRVDLLNGRSSHVTAAAAKSLQSCPTLCDPIDGSPPGSPVPGILQTRTLEWVAISFSNAWKWKGKVKLLSRVWLLATPWTAAHEAPPPMGFSRQEYWSWVPLPSPLHVTAGAKGHHLSFSGGNLVRSFPSSAQLVGSLWLIPFPQNVELSLTPYSLQCELGDPNPWPWTWSSWVLCYPPSELIGLVSLPPGCDQPKSEHIPLLLGTLRAWPSAWPKERGVNCESRSQSPPGLLTASVWHWIHDFTANGFAQWWIYPFFFF